MSFDFIKLLAYYWSKNKNKNILAYNKKKYSRWLYGFMQIPNPLLSIAINRIIQGWQQEQNIAPQGSNHLSSLCQIIQLIPTPFQVHSVIY
jgi:hypothetical protein